LSRVKTGRLVVYAGLLLAEMEQYNSDFNIVIGQTSEENNPRFLYYANTFSLFFISANSSITFSTSNLVAILSKDSIMASRSK
jgi:hypothetical protein